MRRREKNCSCSSMEGHQWLHRSRTAQASTVRIYAKAQLPETLSFRVSKPHAVWHGEWWVSWMRFLWSLVIAATCKTRCECTTRTLLFFPGVEQIPHVQTKLDNLLVLQSLFKYRKFLCFSESLKQSCLNFPLSGFYTGATVNLTPRWSCAQQRCQECDRTLEKRTRRRVNCLSWLNFTSAHAVGTLFSFFC